MTILQIDRTSAFNPMALIGWSIAEQDERSLALAEVDLTKVSFEMILKERESSVAHEEKLKHLKNAGHIRLDVKVFQILWENQHLIPESWKDHPYILFEGTVLRGSDGCLCVLCLYWWHGERHWRCLGLGYRSVIDSVSAVLAS